MGRGTLWLTRRQCGHLHFDVSCDLECWTRVWAILDKIRRRECAFDSNVLDCHVGPALASCRPIEERSKGATTLREREERISLAAESANLAFWSINFERKESWMSDKGRAIFNFGPDEPLVP